MGDGSPGGMRAAARGGDSTSTGEVMAGAGAATVGAAGGPRTLGRPLSGHHRPSAPASREGQGGGAAIVTQRDGEWRGERRAVRYRRRICRRGRRRMGGGHQVRRGTLLSRK